MYQKSRRGYRRILSHQFSFDSSEDADAKAVKTKTKAKKPSKRKDAKAHPVVAVIEASKMEKAAAKPEFLRYLEYMREAGTWDVQSEKPTIYFK